MALAIAVVIVLALVVIVLLARRSRTPAAPPVPRDPFAPGGYTAGDPRYLKAGDMVDYLGERLFVRGSLRLAEGDYRWSEHFVDAMNGTSAGRRWISVEAEVDLEVVMWHEYRGAVPLLPGQPTITVDGVTYHHKEHGTAGYLSEGTTGLPPTGRVEYVDYEGPDGRGLAFEHFLNEPGLDARGQGRWEASLGERVPPGTLTIYPGGGA
ncbi:DUF4178 domain-containing protein [Streptomyces millisiae]|uniref:DUF4178 domain-containing protein n=1 Tax=Streptomyces millisiae TaxID=3075542 RepID=A0ABU2LXM7_9ACTN|nr:DUF4178 domain-containing protein [Streptomyces sp. DSM 44918]MDT0321793.1 DUF4178 domain-containing protein [Streptomyces sp. DSM 44918]